MSKPKAKKSQPAKHRRRVRIAINYPVCVEVEVTRSGADDDWEIDRVINVAVNLTTPRQIMEHAASEDMDHLNELAEAAPDEGR